jgi:hypothetical protein
MLIAECGTFSWRQRRWSRFSPALAEPSWLPAVILAGTPFIYSLIQAVHGAKEHTSVLAAKISLRASTDAPSPGQSKRTAASTIAIETVEAAHIQIGMRGIVGYLHHWVTAVWARMNFNSFR